MPAGKALDSTTPLPLEKGLPGENQDLLLLLRQGNFRPQKGK